MNIDKKMYWEEIIPYTTYKSGTIKYNWMEINNSKVKFKYDDVEGYVNILKYINKNKILISYLDSEPFEIAITNFRNCKMGKPIIIN